MFNTLQQFSGAVATSLVAVIINYVQHHTSHNYEVSTTLGSKAALGVLLLLLLVSFARFAYYLFFAKKHRFHIRQVLHLPFFVKMVVCKGGFYGKIAIIGGGIIGMTLASYLDTSKFNVALFDEGTGQATKASAGIISLGCRNAETNNGIVWLKTALLFPKLIKDFQLDQTIYAQSGTLLLRPEKDLAELAVLAEKRKEEAPEIGNIEWLSPEQTSQALPLLKPAVSLRISGGGRLDGKAYLEHLGQRLAQNKWSRSRQKSLCIRRAILGSSRDRLENTQLIV